MNIKKLVIDFGESLGFDVIKMNTNLLMFQNNDTVKVYYIRLDEESESLKLLAFDWLISNYNYWAIWLEQQQSEIIKVDFRLKITVHLNSIMKCAVEKGNHDIQTT